MLSGHAVWVMKIIPRNGKLFFPENGGSAHSLSKEEEGAEWSGTYRKGEQAPKMNFVLRVAGLKHTGRA